jgi:hypothetical protein
MSTTDQDKSSDKPRQRSRKKDRRGQKPEQQQNPKSDQRADDQNGPVVASTDAPTNRVVEPADVPSIDQVVNVPSVGAVAAANNRPTGIQTIAKAYADYTRKSFQEGNSLVEKLMGVRSFDKAIEVQIEFARQACANLVADSQKISELYGELARQIFRPWEGLVTRAPRAGR